MNIHQDITDIHQAIREAVEARFGFKATSIEAVSVTHYAPTLARTTSYILSYATLAFHVSGKRGSMEFSCDVSVTSDGTLTIGHAECASIS